MHSTLRVGTTVSMNINGIERSGIVTQLVGSVVDIPVARIRFDNGQDRLFTVASVLREASMVDNAPEPSAFDSTMDFGATDMFE